MFVSKIDDDQADAIGGESGDDSASAEVTDSPTESAPEGEADPLAVDDSAEADSGSESAEGDDADADEIDSNADTFNRAYVEKLRRESAGYRERAQRADELAARLHTALVAATGRMADPTDLAFDSAHLDDEQALANAIDELLTRKPHLASRRPFGDVGQGNRGGTVEPVNLADILRSRA